MPITTTAPCPIVGCDGEVDVEVALKVKTPDPEPGHKPGGRINVDVSPAGITLVGDHMRDRHPDVTIPESLRGA